MPEIARRGGAEGGAEGEIRSLPCEPPSVCLSAFIIMRFAIFFRQT